MTEAEESADPLYGPETAARSVGPDYLLGVLNHAVSSGGWDGPSFSVILLLDGSAVSGSMISPDAWIEAMAASFDGAGAHVGARLFRDALRPWMPTRPDTDEFHVRQYLHLKDAVVVRGDGGRINLGALRVHTSRISGWTTGTFPS